MATYDFSHKKNIIHDKVCIMEFCLNRKDINHIKDLNVLQLPEGRDFNHKINLEI